MSYWVAFTYSLLRNPPEFQIYGWVKPTTFSIRGYRPGYKERAWTPITPFDSTVGSGRFVPDAGGTRIELSVGMSRSMKAYTVALGLIAIAFIVRGLAGGGVIGGLIVLAVFITLPYLGHIVYGRRRASVRREILLQFLDEELEAKIAQGGQNSEHWARL